MENSREKITAIGKRLKQEAKKRGLSNQDVADLIHYSSGKQISPIYSGKKAISEDQVILLSKAWDLRKEYLLCMDDWETDSDVLKYAKIADIETFTAHRNYLETLGVCLSPKITSRLPALIIKRNWDLLQNYLTEDSIQEILSRLDFSLPAQDFARKYFSEDIHVDWKKPIDDLDYDFENLGIKQRFGNSYSSDYTSVYCGDSALRVNTDYTVGFAVTYNGQFMGNFTVSVIQRFMEKLDTLVKTGVEILLPRFPFQEGKDFTGNFLIG